MSTEQPTTSTDPTQSQDDAEGHRFVAAADADQAAGADDTEGHRFVAAADGSPSEGDDDTEGHVAKH